MKIYLDTSALAKRYKAEDHSPFVNELVSGSNNHLLFILQPISNVEINSTLKLVSQSRQFDQAWAAFLEESQEVFLALRLDKTIEKQACELPQGMYRKALDALHIAAAMKLGTDAYF